MVSTRRAASCWNEGETLRWDIGVTMLLCIAGDTHGLLDRLYAEILEFEHRLGGEFAWVLHVGDVGIWPDPTRIDRATRNHDGAGDFPQWWSDQRNAPRRTVFIKGNHEDFVWLDSQPTTEVLPDLHYLRNGRRLDLLHDGERVSVGGLGGCFGPSDFERASKNLQGYSKRHYTRDEIEELAGGGHLNVLLVHDAPRGVRFERHRRGAGYVSDAAGLDELLAETRPKICFFGHHHTRLDATVDGVQCLGVNKVPMPGSLLAVEFDSRGEWCVVGEWPRRRDE